jgi:hypothetical protein
MNDITRAAIHDELRSLVAEHASLKTRVVDYQSRRWLSPGEELELRSLQRLKLRRKDRITILESLLASMGSPS